MPAEKPKAQHFVHRAYLEGFQDPELERKSKPALWVYMPGKSPFPQRPERVAKRNYYYCYEQEEQRRFEVEHGLYKLEDAAMPMLRQLRERRFDLAPDDRLTFAGYIALAHVRVPIFERFVNRTHTLGVARRMEMMTRDKSALEWVAQKLSEDEGKRVDPEELRHKLTAGSVVVQQVNRGWSVRRMFEWMLMLQKVIFGMGWTFALAPDNDPGFLTSDNPVSLFDPRLLTFRFPISRDICLVAEAPQTVNVKVNVSASTVRAINKENITRADTQIYAPFRSWKVQKILDGVVGRKRTGRVLLEKGRVVEE